MWLLCANMTQLSQIVAKMWQKCTLRKVRKMPKYGRKLENYERYKFDKLLS